jgi:outer membrane protein W
MKRFALFAAFAVFAVPLFAQQPKNDFQIFAYATDVGITWSESYGTAINSNFGLALSKFVAPHWSMELSVSTQKWWEYSPVVNHFGDPIIRYKRTSYPVSLDGQYHFFNDSRWKPYLGAGVRYVDPNAHFRDFGAQISPEVNGGVSFMMTPNLSLRFDGRLAVRSGDRPGYDPLSRGSIGLGWHF